MLLGWKKAKEIFSIKNKTMYLHSFVIIFGGITVFCMGLFFREIVDEITKHIPQEPKTTKMEVNLLGELIERNP